ncbi:glycosyltransferase [Sabulilitoribacter arenilitoris]|uniref:Glycosyltransferase n=1 Tax=Wocania arenilitoris TaxID=2044858 RepID=A0AAE3JLK7_9FLAO|nr:glycosyltransferase [Wocania arenilitoris]MCF7568389.1 glycosyltransferase [Wocania arenilitoris]
MKKRILVAPLNWGLGHATRCIPIIKALLTYGFDPILASDGNALQLLQKEFPHLTSIELPSYSITYAKKDSHFKLKLLMGAPKLIKTIKTEKKITKTIIENNNIIGIISDNRFGVYSKKTPSVYITHQLNVLSGRTTWLSTKIHQKIIKNFNVCWIPDTQKPFNLSGNLGHTHSFKMTKKYIGPLSRFKQQNLNIINDILVILSGPEPQRTFLEEKLLVELKNYKGKIVFVKGVIEKDLTVKVIDNMAVYNFMTSDLLEKTINESELIITRSGYTTVMDLAKLNKKAFFIPTPRQFEQEYLAKRLSDLKLAPSCSQEGFTLDKLKNIDDYNGLKSFDFEVDFKNLFSLFERE